MTGSYNHKIQLLTFLLDQGSTIYRHHTSTEWPPLHRGISHLQLLSLVLSLTHECPPLYSLQADLKLDYSIV